MYMNCFVRAQTIKDDGEKANRQETENNISGLEAKEFYESIIRHDELNKSNQARKIEKLKSSSEGDTSAAVKKVKYSRQTVANQLDEDHVTGEMARLRFKQINQKRIRRKNNLFRFVNTGNIDGVKDILSMENEWINTTDNYGWTPMMCAVASGNSYMVELLLDMKADIYDIKDHGGQNAWDIAVKLDKSDIIDLLFDRRIKKEPQHQESEDITTEEHCLASSKTFCKDCQMSINVCEMNSHLSSTAHLFNVYKQIERPTQYHLAANNIGYRMLKGAGWSEEIGLGRHGRGSRQPVSTVLKSDQSGLGLDKTSKKRVTHFKANDVASIRAKNRNKESGKFLLKKGRIRREMKSKQWEINFRSYMASD